MTLLRHAGCRRVLAPFQVAHRIVGAVARFELGALGVIGIEKDFSYGAIKSPFAKTHCANERLLPERNTV